MAWLSKSFQLVCLFDWRSTDVSRLNFSRESRADNLLLLLSSSYKSPFFADIIEVPFH